MQMVCSQSLSALCLREAFRGGERGEMAVRTRCFNWFFFLLLLFFFFFFLSAARIRGQASDAGFINIDCGILPNTSYDDGMLKYVSDDGFTDSGENHKVSPVYLGDFAKRYLTLRSFPQGARNCYTFKSMIPGLKYLIRAIFLYGNYDNKNSPWVQFDLYLGVNLWKNINLTNGVEAVVFTETVIEATSDVISVCLVNTGNGTPLISGLSLRPIPSSLYPMVNPSRSLVVLDRINMAPTGTSSIRFPSDSYDRYWSHSENEASWNATSTNSTIQSGVSDHFDPPVEVMQTAVYPADSSKLELGFSSYPGDLNEFIAVLYFSELLPNVSREFLIYINGAQLNDGQPFTPAYLVSDTIYNTNPSAGNSKCNISLVEIGSSTLPPLLNAIEVFVVMRSLNLASDSGDVDAMLAIKGWYQVKKNWMGDPCSPQNYTWDGVNCTLNASGIPRITAINLSYSGLTGKMSTSLANLSAIQYLDLSHNNLTGTIPDSLAYLPSLKLLDLTDNQLSGPIPSELLAKSNNGSITLRTGGNPDICYDSNSCEPNQKKKTAKHIIVISCVVPVVVLLSAAAICLYMLKKRKVRGTTARLQNEENYQLKNREFTYRELEKITSNFARTIGKGGFGTVYHGRLEDDTEVAVKMLSQSTIQGTKEFLVEAQHLTRVHHRNLVSMVGYCMEGDHLALVCEYMSQGTLKEHIKGTHRLSTPLSWGKRLKIALEAAQGLEYLHTGCKPPLIHRDVKTANILLNERLEAKISDFGLSRAFPNDTQSHTSTRVVGTWGYLDPEYYIKNQLSQKSDVYSFGVVLLELITGRSPIVNDPEDTHIVEWVRQKLAKGNIDIVIDACLHQEESIVNSAWKVTNIALACAAPASNKRPTMTNVVMQLRESLALYSPDDEIQFQNTSGENLCIQSSDISQTSALEMEQVGSISDNEGPSAR